MIICLFSLAVDIPVTIFKIPTPTPDFIWVLIASDNAYHKFVRKFNLPITRITVL